MGRFNEIADRATKEQMTPTVRLNRLIARSYPPGTNSSSRFPPVSDTASGMPWPSVRI